ncbi:hypothetical protein [Sphingopyxis sp.]|uniref:hypothetical protein n=1 Tax=Sphingopyxis sp. TaxID=1908224 RepID=UPI001DDDD063|nr:hypothetical protein [Sphingopyxis sp.]MBW8294341.1 hypothetical protein [Sphingopyxis sp.]
MTMFVPILENIRQRFVIQDVTVQAATADPAPGEKKIEFILRTENSPVELVPPLGEAILLMAGIGRALDECNRQSAGAEGR